MITLIFNYSLIPTLIHILIFIIQSAAKLRARHRAGAIDQKSSQEIKKRWKID